MCEKCWLNIPQKLSLALTPSWEHETRQVPGWIQKLQYLLIFNVKGLPCYVNLKLKRFLWLLGGLWLLPWFHSSSLWSQLLCHCWFYGWKRLSWFLSSITQWAALKNFVSLLQKSSMRPSRVFEVDTQLAGWFCSLPITTAVVLASIPWLGASLDSHFSLHQIAPGRCWKVLSFSTSPLFHPVHRTDNTHLMSR